MDPIIYSLFSVATGEFTGARLAGTQSQLDRNKPDGYTWLEGDFDSRLWVVEWPAADDGPQIPVAVARTPARPADNDWQTWAWDAAAGDWRAGCTLKWHQRVAMEPVLAQLKELDAPLARPLSDLLLALAAGQAAPAVALSKVTAVEAQKAPLRAQLIAIEATATIEELQALQAADV